MTDIAATDELFFTRSGLERSRVESIVGDALAGADDGELFLERAETESLVFDDGRLKAASYDAHEGFGLRVVSDETAGYAHSSVVDAAAIARAAETASLATQGRTPESFNAVERLCYTGARGMGALEFAPAKGPRRKAATKIKLDALVELSQKLE